MPIWGWPVAFIEFYGYSGSPAELMETTPPKGLSVIGEAPF